VETAALVSKVYLPSPFVPPGSSSDSGKGGLDAFPSTEDQSNIIVHARLTTHPSLNSYKPERPAFVACSHQNPLPAFGVRVEPLSVTILWSPFTMVFQFWLFIVQK